MFWKSARIGSIWKLLSLYIRWDLQFKISHSTWSRLLQNTTYSWYYCFHAFKCAASLVHDNYFIMFVMRVSSVILYLENIFIDDLVTYLCTIPCLMLLQPVPLMRIHLSKLLKMCLKSRYDYYISTYHWWNFFSSFLNYPGIFSFHSGLSILL